MAKAKFSTTRKYKHIFDLNWVDDEGEEQVETDCWAVFHIKPVTEIETEYQEAIKTSPTVNHAMLCVALDEFGGMDLYDSNEKKIPEHLLTEAARRDPVISAVLMVEYNQGRSGVGLGTEGNSKPKT